MKKISFLFIVFLTLNAISSPPDKLILTKIEGRGCSGNEYCTACKNCSGCKNCAKEGGTCGVCKPVKKNKSGKKNKTR
jgi:hypothetical protein